MRENDVNLRYFGIPKYIKFDTPLLHEYMKPIANTLRHHMTSPIPYALYYLTADRNIWINADKQLRKLEIRKAENVSASLSHKGRKVLKEHHYNCIRIDMRSYKLCANTMNLLASSKSGRPVGSVPNSEG